ncbi:hypothetical protein TELCIR_00252 [Teladorsagia circumcincta]|uniref:Uncharacterized protein n=1 Tax=Teladorsagia circumcincta TaxID=45464 RepID=A0A2G9V6Q6_TELCI|nr:hypothetical protein TELCIR_00252 [Teladorsagia circumcincta]
MKMLALHWTCVLRPALDHHLLKIHKRRGLIRDFWNGGGVVVMLAGMSVEGVLRAIRHDSGWYGDDWSDWMSHSITSNLLLAASSVISYKVFVDRPIECMPPSFFPDSWVTVR